MRMQLDAMFQPVSCRGCDKGQAVDRLLHCRNRSCTWLMSRNALLHWPQATSGLAVHAAEHAAMPASHVWPIKAAIRPSPSAAALLAKSCASRIAAPSAASATTAHASNAVSPYLAGCHERSQRCSRRRWLGYADSVGHQALVLYAGGAAAQANEGCSAALQGGDAQSS